MTAKTSDRLPGYSFAEALAFTDETTKSNLQHWTREGVIWSDIVQAEGKGHHRRFSTLNLIEIQMCSVLNRYHVSVDELRAAVNIFRNWHCGAVAMYESGVAKIPFTPEPWRIALHFKDGQARKRLGAGFLQSQLPLHSESYERVVGSVTAWAALRASTLIQGVPDKSFTHFAALVMGKHYGLVTIDPADLTRIIEGDALVIVLADVVFRVGQQFKRFGVVPEPW